MRQVIRRIAPALAFILCAHPQATSAVPTQVPWQGRLADAAGQPVPNGDYEIRLTLYNAPEGAFPVTGEQHTVSGSTITLAHAPLVPGSETVAKADGSATYVRGVAYTIDNTSGTITRANTTTIPDGTALKVSYQWTSQVTVAFASEFVPVRNGLFATTLTLPGAYSLTGDDWLGVEVKKGAAFEALSPRIRLASVPYALKVASIDGANGGELQGGLTVQGFLTAAGTVSGTAGALRLLNKTITFPGIQGNGVEAYGISIPGVYAVGANEGTGLALSAKGGAAITGNAQVGGTMSVGAFLTAGSVQSSGAVSANSISATTTLTAGSVNSQTATITGGTITGSLVVSGPANVGSLAVVADANIQGTTTMRSDAAVYGSLDVGGRIKGHGFPKPDYESGLQSLPAGATYEDFTLPRASVGVDLDGVMIELHETSQSGEYRWPSNGNSCNYQYVLRRSSIDGQLTLRVLLVDTGNTAEFFRFRVWRVDP